MNANKENHNRKINVCQLHNTVAKGLLQAIRLI